MNAKSPEELEETIKQQAPKPQPVVKQNLNTQVPKLENKEIVVSKDEIITPEKKLSIMDAIMERLKGKPNI